MKNGKEKSMFVREYLWRDLMTVCGLFVILLTIVIGAFLVYRDHPHSWFTDIPSWNS